MKRTPFVSSDASKPAAEVFDVTLVIVKQISQQECDRHSCHKLNLTLAPLARSRSWVA